MEEKNFEKRKVSRREWKTPPERSTSGPGSEYDDGEELGDDDALIRNTKNIIDEVCSTSEVRHTGTNGL